ncbi:MAG: choice-of-anchor V domain-containing protein [Crocinitomicaceae bacterium]
MTKKLLLLIPIAGVLSFSYFDKEGTMSTYHNDGIDKLQYSANPPTQKTGAPGEGNCTDCHSGSTQSAAGTVNFTFSGTGLQYVPGQTYTMDVVGNGVKNGFQLTVLDASDNAAGTFTAGTNSATTTAGGREYIYHTASSGISSWSFDWNAPATDMGNLTVYYSYNRSNDNGATSADVIYLGQEMLTVDPGASITAHQKLDQAFEAYIDNSRQLNIKYQTLDYSKVQLNIIDMAGKLVYREDFGNKNPGAQTAQIDVSQINQSGIYFVSLLIDNEVVNRKVMF